jgi:hypothetical protein
MSAMVFNFHKQFAPLVERGEKRQTIRRKRRDGRQPKPGDTAILYTGLRTRQARKLGERTIVEVFRVHMVLDDAPYIVSNGVRLHPGEAESFAKLDGFGSARELFDWFREQHGPTFDGFCTCWRSADPTPAEPR